MILVNDYLDRVDRLNLLLGAVDGLSHLVAGQLPGSDIRSDAMSALLEVVTIFAEPLREPRLTLRANDF